MDLRTQGITRRLNNLRKSEIEAREEFIPTEDFKNYAEFIKPMFNNFMWVGEISFNQCYFINKHIEVFDNEYNSIKIDLLSVNNLGMINLATSSRLYSRLYLDSEFINNTWYITKKEFSKLKANIAVILESSKKLKRSTKYREFFDKSGKFKFNK